ncbi:MAG: NAD(+)/NADH kinase [Clostridia bacterium]|nr:NAD(+)/NADH kinase [Clostridia bacterium]
MSKRSVGIWRSTDKHSVLTVGKSLIELLKRLDVTPVVEHSLACELAVSELSGRSFKGCEFLCVLGGDGSLLSAVDVALRDELPLLGINLGRVGFLSEIQPEMLEKDLMSVMDGEYYLDHRMLLSARSENGEEKLALNEVSFNRSELSVGILTLEVMADGVTVDRLAGDGLVVASATGSTAYSLSAGGPIIAPGLDCILLTPVCPHTLRARPVVVSADSRVSVRILDDIRRAHVSLDGFKPFNLESDIVTIERAKKSLSFIRLYKRNFFDLMRGKLSDWTY